MAADARVDRLAARIRQLPPLPAVISRLMDVVQNSESSAEDVSRVLASDQHLTGKVLRLVNSSFYGMSRKIATITRAVVILGYQAIRHLALGLAACQAFQDQKSALDRERFWTHSLSCAATAQLVARQTGLPVPEEAFVAGLLHDIGRMALSVAGPREFAGLRPAPAGQLIAREKEVLGMSHAQAGAQLLEHWKLPEALCRVVRFHHSARLVSAAEEPLLTAVMLADGLSSAENADPLELVDSALCARAMSAAGIPAGEYRIVLREMSSRIARARTFLQVAERPSGADPEGTAGGGHEELPAVAVVGTASQRTEWARNLLEHFGYGVRVLAPEEAAGAGGRLPRVALVDPEGLEPGQVEQLCAGLTAAGCATAVLETGAAGESPPPAGCTRLPLVFSRGAVEELGR
jgi:putative nucleotidyltransferase with HDIG domain